MRSQIRFDVRAFRALPRRVFAAAAVAAFSVGPVTACFSGAPLHRPTGPAREPIVRASAPAVLFTFVVREVHASRSRGAAWVSRRNGEDYRLYQRRLMETLSGTPGFTLIEEKKVLDSEAYLAGRFPVREKFFLNPGLLPIVSRQEDEAIMLRLGRALGADYFITALADHDIRKILGFAPRVEARVVIFIYSSAAGFLTSVESRTTRVVPCPDPGDALPHEACAGAIDRELDLAFESVFAETKKKLEQVQARPAGDPDLIRVETERPKTILPEQKPFKHRFPTPR